MAKTNIYKIIICQSITSMPLYSKLNSFLCESHAPSIQKLSPKLKHTINSFSLNKTQHNEMLKIVNCTCCNIQNTLEQLNY